MVKPLIIFCPQNDPLKLKPPKPSENFEMSLRGGVRDYTITVILEKIVFQKASYVIDVLGHKFELIAYIISFEVFKSIF